MSELTSEDDFIDYRQFERTKTGRRKHDRVPYRRKYTSLLVEDKVRTKLWYLRQFGEGYSDILMRLIHYDRRHPDP